MGISCIYSKENAVQQHPSHEEASSLTPITKKMVRLPLVAKSVIILVQEQWSFY
jgi:hypothetical protein